MTKIRASAVHRLLACPGSRLLETASQDSELAKQGSLVHEQVARYFTDGVYPSDKEARVALSYVQRVVDEFSLTFLWAERTFIPLCCGNFTLTGTADLGFVNPDNTVFIVDIKGVEYDHTEWQLCQYVCLQDPQDIDGVIYGIAVNRMDGTYQSWAFTPERRQAFLTAIETALQSDELSAGVQCNYCPCLSDCPLQQKIVSSALQAFSGTIEQFHPEKALAFYVEGRKAVERMLASISDYVRCLAESNGGTYSAGDYTVSFKERNTREVDLLKALPVLKQHLTAEQIVGACKITNTALDAVLKENKPDDHTIKSFKELVTTALDVAGAVTVKTTKILEVKQTKEVTNNE